MKKKFKPDQENITQETDLKTIFEFCNSEGKPVFLSKIFFKKEKTILLYPFSLNRSIGQITPKKIKIIEFKGWNSLNDIPTDFKNYGGYGFKTLRLKQFMSFLYKKFPQLEKLTVGINIKSRFSIKTVTLDWGELETALKQIGREKFNYDRNRKSIINNIVSGMTEKVRRVSRMLNAGELEYFLNRFDSFEKISVRDIDSLTKILIDTPTSKISSTSYIIKTKDKIDTIYLEDIIKKFENLLEIKNDNEEEWQVFFQENTWIMNHLFPFQVLLRKGKAYVGGKTLENEDGRIVDFLFETGFKDNFALLEIKTHMKELLKKRAYREPEVFPISDELSGGVNQCLDQKDIFLRDSGSKQKSLDPKTILVIGQKKKLTKEQITCFELYRANQKNVDIVTFDELLSKLKGLYEVVTGKVK